VSISSTFYARFGVQKCFAHLSSNYSLALYVIFQGKNIGTKVACKLLMKLTQGRGASLKGAQKLNNNFIYLLIALYETHVI